MSQTCDTLQSRGDWLGQPRTLTSEQGHSARPQRRCGRHRLGSLWEKDSHNVSGAHGVAAGMDSTVSHPHAAPGEEKSSETTHSARKRKKQSSLANTRHEDMKSTANCRHKMQQQLVKEQPQRDTADHPPVRKSIPKTTLSFQLKFQNQSQDNHS